MAWRQRLIAAADEFAVADQDLIAAENREIEAGVDCNGDDCSFADHLAAKERWAVALDATPLWSRWWVTQRSYRRLDWSAK